MEESACDFYIREQEGHGRCRLWRFYAVFLTPVER